MKKQLLFFLSTVALAPATFAQFEVGSKAITGSWNLYSDVIFSEPNQNNSYHAALGTNYLIFRKENRSLNLGAGFVVDYTTTAQNTKYTSVSPNLSIGTTRWIPLTFIHKNVYGALTHNVSAGYGYAIQRRIENDSLITPYYSNRVMLGYDFSVGIAMSVKKRWLLSANLGNIGANLGFISTKNNYMIPNHYSNLAFTFNSNFSPASWRFGITYFLKGGAAE